MEFTGDSGRVFCKSCKEANFKISIATVGAIGFTAKHIHKARVFLNSSKIENTPQKYCQEYFYSYWIIVAQPLPASSGKVRKLVLVQVFPKKAL